MADSPSSSTYKREAAQRVAERAKRSATPARNPRDVTVFGVGQKIPPRIVDVGQPEVCDD